jgi:hypothetical protein
MVTFVRQLTKPKGKSGVNAYRAWGPTAIGPAMTEYTVKLIAEDSTANGATREAAFHDIRLAEISSALVDEIAELLKLLKLRESARKAEQVVRN